MSGPCVVPSDRPWPSTSESCMRSASAATKAPWTFSCTSTLFALTHVCPELRNLHAMSADTATSRSASSKTRNGALPPSSREVRFTPAAHHVCSCTPTAVEPVKDTLATFGCVQSSSPTAEACFRGVGSTLKSPLGTPARSPRTARARAVSGVSSAGFTTAPQPAPRAGPTFRVIMAAGKFQGVISAATPTGCFTVSSLRPPTVSGMVAPYTRFASSANHSKKLAA
mmetsp:Transcript_78724/g.157391  ORF Transcript_78724/g.157391 Transcript_78724/m.157391 type:complete len:226 (+) Transcript_78724:1063-1740(+)